MIISYNVILFVRNASAGSIYDFLLQALLILFIVQLSSMKLDKIVLDKIEKYGKLLFEIILIPAIFVISSQAIRLFDGTFSFAIYKLMLPCTFFFLINNKHRFLKTIAFSVFFILITERTLAATILLIYFIYIILGKLTRSRFTYIAFLTCVFIGVIGFTFLYINLQYTDVGQSINQLFRSYTGANFFSGRNTIWEASYRYIADAPYFGYGLNSDVQRLPGVDKSVHNTYLYILIQGGIVGLLLFYFFILSLWKKYYRYLNHHITRLSASYLIGFLIYINFEVSLIGNTAGSSIFMWLVIGIGLINNNNQKLSS
jgi:O-antigen ligase